MTQEEKITGLMAARSKKHPSLHKQILEIEREIRFLAYMHQWRINMGELSTEAAIERLEPLKAARDNLRKLKERLSDEAQKMVPKK